MEERSAEKKLSREVLLPQQPNSGVGIMVVAATAMFFAVASSAFVLRARMAHRSHCSSTAAGHEVRLVTPVRTVAPKNGVLNGKTPGAVTAGSAKVLVPNANCGKALYGTDRNGKASVYFTVCPPSSSNAGFVSVKDRSAKSRTIFGGVQVHRVVR